MQAVLAIDLGGTSLRAGVLDPAGETLAIAAHSHRIGAEVDAVDWWRALGPLLRQLDLQRFAIAGVGLSGFTRSQVLVDAAGRPVRPAQCFPDGRADAEAGSLHDATHGTWTEMTAWHPLARLCWARRHDPAAFARARHLLQPKDYLGMALTGRAAGDTVSNAWALDRTTGGRSDAGFRSAGLDPALLPDLLRPQDRVGIVRPGLPAPYDALAGVPVFAGAMDTWCATIGAGAVRAGGGYIVSGTTDVCGVFTTAPLSAPGLVTLPWLEGLFHIGGPSQAGADCAAWAAELLGLPDVAALIALAGTATGRGGALLFLPYLTGERAPLWQPGARGVFLGLHRDHGPADLAYAVLQGVALANRDLLSRVPGPPLTALHICGGGARADLWCQIRADMLGVPVGRVAVAEPGLSGAAACAWVGLGRHASFSAAQDGMAPIDRTFRPNPGHQDALFALFREAQGACVDLTTRLAAL